MHSDTACGLAAGAGAAQDPFALALRKIEFESGRVMQPQILFLKSTDLLPLRTGYFGVESRHGQLRQLRQTLVGIAIEPCNST